MFRLLLIILIFLLCSCGRPIPMEGYAVAFKFCGPENVKSIVVNSVDDQDNNLDPYIDITCINGKTLNYIDSSY